MSPLEIEQIKHISQRKRSHYESFWIRVGNFGDGCWNWIGGTGNGGYGVVKYGSYRASAPRFAYQMTHGIILHRNTDVGHKCDNRLCVRPDHLFLGTRKENIADCSAKGRRSPQAVAANHHAKLTPADIDAIRMAVGPRGLKTALAETYGVSRTCISRIRSGKSWASYPRKAG